MSFQIVTSASNTVTKTLGAVDNVVDGLSLGSCMFKTAMEEAYIEQRIESLSTRNSLIEKTTNLTEEQITSLKLPM